MCGETLHNSASRYGLEGAFEQRKYFIWNLLSGYCWDHYTRHRSHISSKCCISIPGISLEEQIWQSRSHTFEGGLSTALDRRSSSPLLAHWMLIWKSECRQTYPQTQAYLQIYENEVAMYWHNVQNSLSKWAVFVKLNEMHTVQKRIGRLIPKSPSNWDTT